MPLPKIIFCENHYDPITVSIMIKLAPKLKELGYELFFAEQPASWTAEDHIELIDYIEMTQTHISADRQRKLVSEKMKDIVELNIQYALPRSQYCALYKSFLQNLESLEIQYVGIDVPRVSVDSNDYLSGDGLTLRDKRMAKSYLCEKNSAFGFNGAAHAKGMQRQILEHLPIEQALSHFYFIHLYKEEPMSEYESSLRAGEIDHPLGMHLINANEMSEEDIVELILQHLNRLISQKQEAPLEIQEKEKKRTALYNEKEHLLYTVKTTFGEEGRYKTNLFSKLDPNGESYRQELIDFISRPQHYDVIIDKLEILARKAKRDILRRSDIFSFFTPMLPDSKFYTLAHEIVDEFKNLRAKSLEILLSEHTPDWGSIFKKKEDSEMFNPGYNWKP